MNTKQCEGCMYWRRFEQYCDHLSVAGSRRKVADGVCLSKKAGKAKVKRPLEEPAVRWK